MKNVNKMKTLGYLSLAVLCTIGAITVSYQSALNDNVMQIWLLDSALVVVLLIAAIILTNEVQDDEDE
jgi:1,4-dihydroxy-2-naphthoate octaprenyltransferase